MLTKAVVAAFNQEKPLVGAFSVITSLRMELYEALLPSAGLVLVACQLVSVMRSHVSVERLLARHEYNQPHLAISSYSSQHIQQCS